MWLTWFTLTPTCKDILHVKSPTLIYRQFCWSLHYYLYSTVYMVVYLLSYAPVNSVSKQGCKYLCTVWSIQQPKHGVNYPISTWRKLSDTIRYYAWGTIFHSMGSWLLLVSVNLIFTLTHGKLCENNNRNLTVSLPYPFILLYAYCALSVLISLSTYMYIWKIVKHPL